MPALNTDIFVMTRPHGDLLVPVTENKARDGVGHSRLFALAEIVNAAAAVFFGTAHRFERNVADLVAEQQAGQLPPQFAGPAAFLSPTEGLGFDG